MMRMGAMPSGHGRRAAAGCGYLNIAFIVPQPTPSTGVEELRGPTGELETTTSSNSTPPAPLLPGVGARDEGGQLSPAGARGFPVVTHRGSMFPVLPGGAMLPVFLHEPG